MLMLNVGNEYRSESMKMYVYEDGDMIGEVDVDVNDREECVRVLREWFVCEGEEMDEELVEISYVDGEWLVELSECEYL